MIYLYVFIGLVLAVLLLAAGFLWGMAYLLEAIFNGGKKL